MTEKTKTAKIISLFKPKEKTTVKCNFHGGEVPIGKAVQNEHGVVICFGCVALANKRLEEENE